MKIYTGTGDKGKTSLFSGERLKKNSIRVDAYGGVDELSSFCGAIHATLPEGDEKPMIAAVLREIQTDLFRIGALLATSPESPNSALLSPVKNERTIWLEKTIDEMEKKLPELRSFVFPGGHPSSAWSQVTRTVCRRVERCVITLADQENSGNFENVLCYLNRLSDLFFVLARFCNMAAGVAEITWDGCDET